MRKKIFKTWIQKHLNYSPFEDGGIKGYLSAVKDVFIWVDCTKAHCFLRSKDMDSDEWGMLRGFIEDNRIPIVEEDIGYLEAMLEK